VNPPPASEHRNANSLPRPAVTSAYRRVSDLLFVTALTVTLGALGCTTAQKRETQKVSGGRQQISAHRCCSSNDGESNVARSEAYRPGSELGMEVLSLRLSAAGYMLDLRYRVTDPERASTLMNPELRPHLIDQKTGAKLAVPRMPKVGPLRQTAEKLTTDRTYFFVFANPGRFLKTGDTVTLALGDHRVENLVIE